VFVPALVAQPDADDPLALEQQFRAGHVGIDFRPGGLRQTAEPGGELRQRDDRETVRVHLRGRPGYLAVTGGRQAGHGFAGNPGLDRHGREFFRREQARQRRGIQHGAGERMSADRRALLDDHHRRLGCARRCTFAQQRQAVASEATPAPTQSTSTSITSRWMFSDCMAVFLFKPAARRKPNS